MNASPALWRSLSAVAACLAIGIVLGSWAVGVAAPLGPRIGASLAGFLDWRSDLLRAIGVGLVLAVFVFVIGYLIGFLLRAGRFVAGWLLGFTISEPIWRPAIARALDGAPGAGDRLFLAIVQALALALVAAVALDAGRRTPWRRRRP